MASRKPTIHLIAGCSGAGKTTFAIEYLPKEMKCLRFLNPDGIARGLSPLAPAAGAFKAARLLLREVRDGCAGVAPHPGTRAASPPRLLAESETCPLGDLRRMLLAK